VKHKIIIISLSIPIDLKQWLDKQAILDRRSLSNLVVSLLEKIREQKARPPSAAEGVKHE
jgi:hypothetical protein